MASHSPIEWTEATWNPIAGCSIVSPGCSNCYAMRRVAPRLSKNPATPHYAGTVQPSNGGPVWTGKINIASEKVLTAPLRWKRPRLVFVNSTSDLFHEAVPDETIDRIFAVMALCPQHTFQVLTKRSARMREYLARPMWSHHIAAATAWLPPSPVEERFPHKPLPNVWLGVSAERQKEADERIPDLLATPAAIRFVSAEPLIGPIDFSCVPRPAGWQRPVDDIADGVDALRYSHCPTHDFHSGFCVGPCPDRRRGLDWIIVGGESGAGARPMHPDWAREIRDQCAAADVPFFFKQWGEWLDADQFFDRFEQGPGRILHLGQPWRPARPLSFEDAAYMARLFGHPFEHQSDGRTMLRLGKRRAGRLLDGHEHTEWPQPKEVPAL